jgi:hypothetical protein
VFRTISSRRTRKQHLLQEQLAAAQAAARPSIAYRATSPQARSGGFVTTSGGKTAHIWEILADTQSRVSHAKAAVARCLTPEQREAVFLPREPPVWCIEMGKWPYCGPEWKQWLADVRAGKKPPLPAR